MINFVNVFQDELAPTVFQFMLDNARFDEDETFILPSVREIMLNFKIGYNRANRMIDNLINNNIISKVDDEHTYSKYTLINKYLIQMVEEDENIVEVKVWQIPFEADLERFINELPKEVRDKINITNPMLENHVSRISVSYPNGTLIAKTGNYIFQDVNNGNVWVKSFLEDKE